MTKFQKLTAFAASAAAALLVAGSAQAVTFATIIGTFISVNDLRTVSTGTYAGFQGLTAGGLNTFSFTTGGLPTFLRGTLSFTNAGSFGPATETTSGNNQFFVENGFAGSFNEVYEGKTMTVDGVHLVKGVTSLLSGNFDMGVLNATNTIIPLKGIGGSLDANVTSYSSPFASFGSGGLTFDVELTNANNFWRIDNKNHVLNNTTTHGSGMFSATVPEPAAWSLMLLGVGTLGATLRRKRALVAAA